MPPDLALLSTLIGSNYPCLELIGMIPKVFEPLEFNCIYILSVFAVKPFRKQLECKVIYIPIITISHATSYDVKINMVFYNLIRRRRCNDVIYAVPLIAEKLLVNVFLLQIQRLCKFFRQDFD